MVAPHAMLLYSLATLANIRPHNTSTSPLCTLGPPSQKRCTRLPDLSNPEIVAGEPGRWDLGQDAVVKQQAGGAGIVGCHFSLRSKRGRCRWFGGRIIYAAPCLARHRISVSTGISDVKFGRFSKRGRHRASTG